MRLSPTHCESHKSPFLFQQFQQMQVITLMMSFYKPVLSGNAEIGNKKINRNRGSRPTKKSFLDFDFEPTLPSPNHRKVEYANCKCTGRVLNPYTLRQQQRNKKHTHRNKHHSLP